MANILAIGTVGRCLKVTVQSKLGKFVMDGWLQGKHFLIGKELEIETKRASALQFMMIMYMPFLLTH